MRLPRAPKPSLDFAHCTSSEVAEVFTATLSLVAGPSALLVNPHRRNSLMASAAACGPQKLYSVVFKAM
jgi:hypothetical protein